MSGFEAENKPPGINKHLYSTNPDAIVGENIYSSDTTSINKEESYQTLDNRTVPVDTGEKVNPFNVQGVPGCKECGGSGWKDTKKHPHPCNECAKRTVPVIDTYLTKVGHTAVPAAEVVQKPEIKETVKEVEMHGTMPVTREVRHTEEVPVKTQVPVTRYEEVVQNVPIEKVDYVTENIPVKATVPISEQCIQDISGPQIGMNNQEILVNPISQGGTYSGIDEVTRNQILTSGSHAHDSRGQEIPNLKNFVGVPGCKDCGGEGWRISKLTGKKKPCKHCVQVTGNCPLCGNTGIRFEENIKCKCQYAKNL
jgi:hypothetical protein